MDEPRDQPTGQPSSRARRIGDEEWEAYRPMIENTYRKQRSSRNAVIEELRQSGFTVTEKQLKHILMKWRMKKNVSSTEMESMLAIKRQRDSDGKASRFAYHGIDVSEEKLQRAAKRLRNSTTSFVLMPPYIEVLSPEPPNRSPALDKANAIPGSENPSGEQFHLDMFFTSKILSSPSQDPSLSTTEPVVTLNASDAALGLLPFHKGQGASWNAHYALATSSEEHSPHMPPDCFTSMFDSDYINNSLLETPLVNTNGSMYNRTQDTFLPPVSTTFEGAELRTALPTPVPESLAVSPVLMSLALDQTASEQFSRQRSINRSLKDKNTSDKVLFYGTNAENIIPAIRMIQTLLQHLQDTSFRNSHAVLWGPVQKELADEIRSGDLLSEIMEIKCWAHEEVAQFTRRQKTARPLLHHDNSSSCGNYGDHHQASLGQSESMLNNAKRSTLTGTMTSYCSVSTHCKTGGTFRIGLHQTPKKASEHENDTQYYLAISAIPEVKDGREAAVHMVFPRNAQALPIYPTIRTFNIVQDDSEIIRCVRMNDSVGFKKLIGEGGASPRDVDPRGTSLLYYSIFSGCSDIFRLLIENGANTDQCNAFGNLASLIDSIWGLHLNFTLFNAEGWIEGFPTMDLIKDIDQCRSMTEIALANGCLAEETIPWSQMTPGPLFEIIHICEQQITAHLLANKIKQLLAAGYDSELRNLEGETPLLYAAFSSVFRSLTVLKLLLAEKTDRDAVDNHRRGALHLCLDFSASLYRRAGYLSVCRNPTRALREQSIDKGAAITEPSIEKNEEEEAPYGDFIEQESHAGFAGSNNNDCFSETDDEEPSQGNCQCDDCDSVDTDDEEDRQECYWCDDGVCDPYFDEPALFYYCEARDIDDFEMPEVTLGDNEYPDSDPKPWMCKAYLRLKLLVLLQAGCNPNIRDDKGASPSDYAGKESLWLQWIWALEKSGWEYNEDTNLCQLKDTTP